MTPRTPALAMLPVFVGCIGVRDVEPDWLSPSPQEIEEQQTTSSGGSTDPADVEVQDGCDEDEITPTASLTADLGAEAAPIASALAMQRLRAEDQARATRATAPAERGEVEWQSHSHVLEHKKFALFQQT